VTNVSAGDAACPYGGVKIETGLDANRSGVLDAGEIIAAQTANVCKDGPVCSGCALIATTFTAATDKVNVIYQYANQYAVNQTSPSVVTARVIVAGSATATGSLQLGVQQGSAGGYGYCYGGLVPLSTLVGRGPMDVTFDLSGCDAATTTSLATNPPLWLVVNVNAGATNPNTVRVFVDSLSVSNSTAAPLSFAASTSVSSAMYQADKAWLNNGSPSGTTLTWYNY
jgi:hypothetical protein